MNTKPSLSQKHSFISETEFGVKAALLTFYRGLKNGLIQRPGRFKKNNRLNDAPVITSSESELWNSDDNESNWILTAGKIENLRIAARKLNGIEVKAGEVFSFWKHIGRPSRWRGFVMGREIREGCIVPTIAGGLCQLSNAMYDAAVKAGFEIVERHKHTKVIKGSLAEHDRDATVKWNYIDLRFKPAYDFKIEIGFTSEKLIIQFKSYQNTEALSAGENNRVTPSKLNDCFSCGNTSCFKHPGDIILNEQKRVTAFILDEKWPEYEQYIRSACTGGDYFIVPFTESNRVKIARYAWNIKNNPYSAFSFTALQRAFFIRRAARSNGNLPSTYLKYDSKIINSIKKAVPVTCTHVVIAQNLLPFAWQEGILWGRTFDVLMTRLPMQILHEKLDAAHLTHQDSKTLNDFRADKDLIDLENTALTKANRIITPHKQIAKIFNNKSVKLNWVSPQVSHTAKPGSKVLFPASALARKGAYEIKKLAEELGLDIVITGRAVESENFWMGVNITFAGPNIFDDVKLVVLPAYIEHQPKVLLKALALNIPVIATDACGLSAAENLTIIPAGDYDALKEAVQDVYLVKEIGLA